MTISNSQIEKSQALEGEGTLLINQTTSTFFNLKFADNQAALKTHGIIISGLDKMPKQSIIQFQNSLFDTFSHIKIGNIMGTYLHLNNQMTSSDINEFPIILISGCSFKMGFAEYGGAIYISNDLVMKISNTTFSYNYAENGGAIYFGKARKYVLEIGAEEGDSITFMNNLAYEGGDHLYVGEDAETVASRRRRLELGQGGERRGDAGAQE